MMIKQTEKKKKNRWRTEKSGLIKEEGTATITVEKNNNVKSLQGMRW